MKRDSGTHDENTPLLPDHGKNNAIGVLVRI